MTHEDYMKRAIELAKLSESKKGCAIGAVIVKDGEIVAEGMSLSGATYYDVIHHAETSAVIEASNSLKTMDLSGCVLYGTLEPCSMCLGASLWANMKEVYFGAYAGDVAGNNYEYEDYSSEDLAKKSQRWDGSRIKVTGGILREECKELLRGYNNWAKQ